MLLLAGFALKYEAEESARAGLMSAEMLLAEYAY